MENLFFTVLGVILGWIPPRTALGAGQIYEH